MIYEITSCILKTPENSIFKKDILFSIRACKSRNSPTISAFTSACDGQNIELKNRIFRCFEYILTSFTALKNNHRRVNNARKKRKSHSSLQSASQ